MDRSIRFSFGGRNAKVADFLVNRLLPGELCNKVGPFVLLDHVYPIVRESQKPDHSIGTNARPLRGIATLSYLFSGSLEHFDSRNHHGIINEGEAQWQKAGNGIVHEERVTPEFQRTGGVLHAVQFWINLPSSNKTEEPEYRVMTSCDIPQSKLPDNAGTFKVLLGRSGELVSPVRTFLNEFSYHIKLNPKSSFSISVKSDLECAVFVPSDEIHVNSIPTVKSRLLILSNEGSTINFYNPGIVEAHAIIFGGSEYAESIVTEGPFVMNCRSEIKRAYDDFFEGRYGTLAKAPGK